MRRSARPLTTFLFCLGAVCLAVETARAGHPVQIGSRSNPESALLAEIAAELVRGALDVPFLVPDLADSSTAWKALLDGDIDVYPESLGTLTTAILGDPDLNTVDRLRSALAKHQVRMTGPLGSGDLVLLFRADLPDRAPGSGVVLLRMEGLLAPGDMQAMAVRLRSGQASGSTIAADFLRDKFRASPGMPRSFFQSARKLIVPACLLAAAFVMVAARRWLPLAFRSGNLIPAWAKRLMPLRRL